MPSSTENVLSYLRVMVTAWREDRREDAELLARFAEIRDEAAFVVLVGRHGPLVWQTCRRLLGDTPDAEDAFQAVFLALARKAGRFPVESLAGWLHRVARRVALNARVSARRQQVLERKLRTATRSEGERDAGRSELYAVLEEELAGLPERLRVPLLLRYLENKSQVEVARFLGCSRGVLQRRLARGEAVLRERLERRGLGVGVVSVGALLASTVSASAVPARLIGSTARAALRSLSFPLSELSKAAALAEGVVKTMVVTKVKIVTVLLGATLCLAGGGVLAYQALAGNAAEPLQTASEPGGETEAPRQAGVMARVDCYGDPLPEHALARMGTTRLWRREQWRDTDKNAFAFSPDGKTLATRIDGMTVCLWDTTTGKEIRRLTTKAAQGRIRSLGFSPDGKTLITQVQLATANSYDEMVCWWEIATGKFLGKQQYQGHKRDNEDHLPVDFLPAGKMLGYVSFRKSKEKEIGGAYVWDVATGKEICQLNRPMKEWEGWRMSTAFSPDGKLLATVEGVNNIEKKTTISLWDVVTGKQIRQLIYKDVCAKTVAFSSDGKMIATGGFLEPICVWEVATGKQIYRFPLPQKDGHAIETFDGPLTYSPDGKTLVGGRAVHLWDMGTGKQIRSLGWKEAEVAVLSPDGKTLAVGDKMGAISLWEVATGKEIGPRKGYRGGIRSVAYSPDGKTLASMGGDGMVRQWEIVTGKEIRQLAKGSDSFAYSSDGKMLVSTTADGMVHLWDIATGKEIRQFDGKIGGGTYVFSPDGKKLAKNWDHKLIYVWGVATGKQIYTLETYQDEIGAARQVAIAFSPDGRLLATSGQGNTVSLWEAATGKLIGQLGQPKKQTPGTQTLFVSSLAFSPDSRLLATASSGDVGGNVHVWEMASGKEIYQLAALKPRFHDGCVLAFSPDGRMLATVAQGTSNRDGSIDPKIHLWEVPSGKEIGWLTGHQAPVQALAFSPDGKTLASGSDDLTCLVWDLASVGRLKPVPAQPLSPERLEAAWADLAQDPAKAYGAIGILQTVPTQTIALLRARVRPIAPADPKQMKRWIADLDADNFMVREKAQREIRKLGEVAVPALRQALKGQPALEVKRRLQALLGELESKLFVVSPDRLRELRAVHVLESIGAVEAQQVLQAWTKGVAGARLTVEAQAALTRLSKRSVAKP